MNEASKFIILSRDAAIKRCVKNNKIWIDRFLLEDEFIQKEILYYFLGSFYQDDLILVNDKHIHIILNLIRGKRSNGVINLPNDVLAKKSYREFELVRETDVITSYEIEFDKCAILPNNHSIELIDSTESNSNFICRLNSQEIVLPLIIRTRKMGDKIFVKGLNGSKKIKDIFINEKVSLEERDSWPIVLDSSGNVVWIPGIKKSKFDKKMNEVYDIILRYK